MKKVMLLLFLVMLSAGLIAQPNRGVRISAGLGGVVPVGQLSSDQYGSGINITAAAELFTIAESRIVLINGGLETGYQSFGENKVSMNAIPFDLFVNAGFRTPARKLRIRTGFGVGLVSNTTSKKINNEDKATYPGVYVPLALNFRMNAQTRFVVEARGYEVFGMVGYKDVTQDYATIRVGFEYFIPL